jgi:hypothetical protein
VRVALVSRVEQEAHPARRDDLDQPQAVIRQNKHGIAYNANAGPT